MKTEQPGRGRRIAGLAFLLAGISLVVAAVLLLLFADLAPAIAAAMGVPGLALIAASQRTRSDVQG